MAHSPICCVSQPQHVSRSCVLDVHRRPHATTICALSSRREALSIALAAVSLLPAQLAAAAVAEESSACGGIGLPEQLLVEAAQYDSFADTYDDLNDSAVAEVFGLPALRKDLLARASGDVLEVGVGTGINLALYRFGGQGVNALTAVDLSAGMLDVARRRATSLQLCGSGTTPRVTFQRADATQLPFADASFDVCVDTFSLCVLADAAPAALAELARVLRPGGRALLLEHTRSDFPPLAGYQDMTATAVAATSKGCVWNQDVLAMLPAAGLRLIKATPALGGTLCAIEAARA